MRITKQEKDVKAADKEDADKEDVEETKAQKIPSNSHSLFQIYWKRIELLDSRKKPTQDIIKLSAPLKNKIQPCHQNHEYDQSFLNPDEN